MGEPGGKQPLRDELWARRHRLNDAFVDAQGLRVQARVLAAPYFIEANTVALYAPTWGEVPTSDILKAALADGKAVCYPVVRSGEKVLEFRLARSESELERRAWGGREPTDQAPIVPLESIDLFVVPGLGFSRTGQRLGRGRGYYDATLALASPRSRRIGIAFSNQILPDLPTLDHDVAMDIVVTELECVHGLDRDPLSKPC